MMQVYGAPHDLFQGHTAATDDTLAFSFCIWKTSTGLQNDLLLLFEYYIHAHEFRVCFPVSLLKTDEILSFENFQILPLKFLFFCCLAIIEYRALGAINQVIILYK